MKKLILLLFFSTIIYASDKISMAVYEFDASGITQDLASSVSGFIEEGLMQTGRFNLVERKDVQKILKEQMFQKTGCTSTECAVEVGKMLNVSNIVKGKVSQMGTRTVISISLVDVEAGKIVLTDSVECGSHDFLNTASKKLAEHFSKGVAVKGKILKVMDNEVIINIGLDDGIQNADTFAVERLGEAVKDDNGKIAFQEKARIGMISVKDAASSGSKAQIIDGQGRIKIGDVVELKIEKMKPLEPILTTGEQNWSEPASPASGESSNTKLRSFAPKNSIEEEAPFGFFGTYEFVGGISFEGYNASNVKTITETKIGKFNDHISVGLDFGTSVNEFLTIGNTISFILPPRITDMSNLEDTNTSLLMMQDGINLRFYPFVGLLNPSFSKYKKASEQRGIFEPYFSFTGNLYLGLFNVDINSLSTVTLDPAFVFGFGIDLKTGFELGNVFYVEFMWRILSRPAGRVTNHSVSTTNEFNYIIDLNTTGIGAGFRF